MKKVIQHKSKSGNQEITYTINEALNKLKDKNLAPKKLAAANKMLHNLKGPIPSSLNIRPATK